MDKADLSRGSYVLARRFHASLEEGTEDGRRVDT
jgi:hypothetical protein